MKSYAESDGAKMKQMEIELKDVTIHVETTEKKIDEVWPALHFYPINHYEWFVFPVTQPDGNLYLWNCQMWF